ncbi:MAG: hypothetical protein GF368_05385 [Candidatus Aenigmarchaeota archaeon]|nr:hypothetical protein [Candidatus Aenigmarchaeota archaeon]
MVAIIAFALAINAVIFVSSIYLNLGYSTDANFLNIYYMALFAVLTTYATLTTLSTSLSKEVTGELAWEYVIKAKWNIVYLTVLLSNFLMVFLISPWYGTITQSNLLYIFSVAYLFIATLIILALILSNVLNPGKIIITHTRSILSFIEPRVEQYPDKKGLKIRETSTSIHIITDDYPQDHQLKVSKTSDIDDILPQSPEDKPRKPFYVEFNQGILRGKDLSFLNKYRQFQIEILKYNIPANFLGFTVSGHHFLSEDEEKELKKNLKENLGYENITQKLYNEYEKIKRSGNERIFIDALRGIITKSKDVQRGYSLYKLFEPLFIDYQSKTGTYWEKTLDSQIHKLYNDKELFLEDPSLIADLQNKLLDVLFQGFRKTERFNIQLNTSGLYTKEFLDIRYLDKFKTSTDIVWLQKHSTLMTNTIDNLFNLCYFILDLDLENNIKSRFFQDQISQLNRCLEHYMNLNEEDFHEDYYRLEHKKDKTPAEQEILDLVEYKLKTIEANRNHLALKQLELYYLTLDRIRSGTLNKDFFDIIWNLFKIKKFEEEYYKYHLEIGRLNLLNYNEFLGGAQGIEPFNSTKYQLLRSLWIYKHEKKIDLERFEKENFSDPRHSFEDQISSLDLEFINKFYECDEVTLEKFKEDFNKKIDETEKKYQEEKIKYLGENRPKQEFVEKFVQDCKKVWEDFQNNLSKIFDLQVLSGGNEVKTVFGQYVLYPKEWFLDSFEGNISLVRDSGRNFGNQQINGKQDALIKRVNELFDKEKDKEIEIRNFTEDVSKKIKRGKTYYLFFGADQSIYDLPLNEFDITWPRDRIVTAEIKINNSLIKCCRSNSAPTLLFEEKAIILRQFSQGFDEIDEQLVVKVEALEDESEIRKIIEKDNNYKSPDDVKQMVKIRIAEKFEVERKPETQIFRLKFKPKNP